MGFAVRIGLRGCPGSPNDVDVYLLNSDDRVVAGSIFGNINTDASESWLHQHGADGGLQSDHRARTGPLPGFIKYVQFGSSSITIRNTTPRAGPSSATKMRAGAEAVGAAFFGSTPAFGVNPPLKEAFSAAGSAR